MRKNPSHQSQTLSRLKLKITNSREATDGARDSAEGTDLLLIEVNINNNTPAEKT
jgi:hypothetical protein